MVAAAFCISALVSSISFAQIANPSDLGGPSKASEHPGANVAGAEVRGGPNDTRASDPRCEVTAVDWNWFADHFALSITYVVEGAPGRTYEIATGVSVFGKPRGATVRKIGKSEVTAYGIGAINVRVVDGGPAMPVCVAQGDLSTVTFVNVDF